MTAWGSISTCTIVITSDFPKILICSRFNFLAFGEYFLVPLKITSTFG
jgi:hypothetical protein